MLFAAASASRLAASARDMEHAADWPGDSNFRGASSCRLCWLSRVPNCGEGASTGARLRARHGVPLGVHVHLGQGGLEGGGLQALGLRIECARSAACLR